MARYGHLFLDINEYRDDRCHGYGYLYRKHDFVLSSCPRTKCVLMTLNGDILDTVYCENNGELKGTLLDIRFCTLNNVSVITHEVRDEGQHIMKREKTGEVTKFKYVHLVSRSHEQANTEMYIWCLEPLNKLNT